MIPQTTPPNIGDQMQAAIALGREARRRGQEAILAAPQPQESTRHLLIEGTVRGLYIDVTMPSGDTWHFRHGLDATAEGRTLLVHIDTAAPQIARVFQPSAEGIHPFVGEIIRFGVERKAA